MPKVRLDQLLVERGLAGSRAAAQRLIMAGAVRVDGQVMDKPGAMIPNPDAVPLEVVTRPPFVSRGGEKLQAALEAFQIDVTDWVCADVGASTGGFTDCLLKAGAGRVYAIDVGHGVLDWSLRNHPRVVVMENTNARYLETLPEPIDLATVDASFISIRLLLPVVKRWLKPTGELVVLIKPQFEAGRKDLGRGGVVKDPEIHRRVLTEVLSFASERGLRTAGLLVSPLRGPKGNVEFLAWLRLGLGGVDLPQAIEQVVNSI